MYRSVDDFLRAWSYESDMTQKLLDRITDDALPVSVDTASRSVGGLAWHLAISPTGLLSQAGMEISGPGFQDAPATTAKEIVEAYSAGAATTAARVKAEWNDGMLADSVEMFGQTWTYGSVLSMIVLHQAHHRGQLTMAMRMAGLPIIGVYGPTREDWIAQGANPLP